MHMRRVWYQKDTGRPPVAPSTKGNELLSFLHNIHLISEFFPFSSKTALPCSISVQNIDMLPEEQNTIAQVRLLQVADTY